MTPTSLRKHRSSKLVALAVIAVAALAGCDAGWVGSLAGSGTAGTSTGTVVDSQAQFTAPTGVVAIPGGGFYVYDAATCAIYKESHGQTSVYAGTPGTCGYSGDGGSALDATLDSSPSTDPSTKTVLHGPNHDVATPMALASDGSLYFVESTIVGWQSAPPDQTFPIYTSQVRRISPDGTITAVGDGINSSLTVFITGLTTTPNGNVLAAVVNVSNSATTIVRIAADGSQSAVTSTPGMVFAIAAISDDTIATVNMSSIDRVDLATGVASPTGQTATPAGQSLAASPDGTIYIGSQTSNVLLRIAPDNTSATIAGDGTADPGTTAQMGDGRTLALTPTGLALTPNDGLLISSGHVVYRLVDPAHAAPTDLGASLKVLRGSCTDFFGTTSESSASGSPSTCPTS
jgi:hypothetical protein